MKDCKKNKNGKVFLLLASGQYIEITYRELVRRCEENPTIYNKKKFIPMHGMLLEVTQDDYSSFYKANCRQKYMCEESELHSEVS